MKGVVLERIIEFKDYLGVSKKAFAEKIGMEQTTVNNQLIGKRSVSFDLIISIVDTFPDISAEWLLRGEGEMLRLDTNKNNISLINVDGDLKTDIEMEREIRRLRASLDLALEKNERLEAELVEYKAKEALSKEQAV